MKELQKFAYYFFIVISILLICSCGKKNKGLPAKNQSSALIVDAVVVNPLKLEDYIYATANLQYEKGAISGFDFRQTQLSLIRAQNTSSALRFALKSIEIELYRLSGDILEMYTGG